MFLSVGWGRAGRGTSSRPRPDEASAMSTDPLQFRRFRPTSAPDEGNGEMAGHPSPWRGERFRDRAAHIPVADWSTLGRNERHFFDSILTYLLEGKGAIAQAMDTIRARLAGDGPSDLEALFEQIVDHQAAHIRAVDTVRRRLDEVDGDVETPEPDPGPLIEFFDAITERSDPDDGETLTEVEELCALATAIAHIVYGISSQTGYGVLTVFLERNGILEECADLLEALRVSDEQLAAVVTRHRQQLRDDLPALESRSDHHVDRGIVASIDLVRGIQDRFDFLSFGLVPDEFVAFALDRYIEISEGSGSPAE